MTFGRTTFSGSTAGGVRLPPLPLAPEGDLRVAPASDRRVLFVARAVALQRGPRLQQRAVHGEVVGGEQPALPRLGHPLDDIRTRAGDLA